MIELKSFEELYPDFATFDNKVLEPIRGQITEPIWMDDAQLYFKMSAVYTFLFNKYSEFTAINTDNKQHMLMQNALVQTLPVLYLKSISISNETLSKLSITALLENIERRYNELPNDNYSSTETVYSSTPEDSQKSGTFDVDNVREKNIINRKDATIRVRELSNLIDKYNAMGKIDASGFVVDFINTIEISSLWEYFETGEQFVVQGAKGDQGEKGEDGTSIVAKGNVPTFNDLPTDAQINDAYVVDDVIRTYVWEGSAWVDFGPAGTQGPEGKEGPAGKDGTNGTDGKDGVDGAKGDTGADGADGKDGTNGADSFVPTRARFIEEQEILLDPVRGTANGAQVIAGEAKTTADKALTILKQDYEKIGDLSTSEGNSILIDFSKPNDFIAVSSHQFHAGTYLSLCFAIIQNFPVNYTITTQTTSYGQIAYNPTTKLLTNPDPGDTVQVFRRKEA